MAASFGFSVGDFIAVGKLIGQVAAELRENGGAAPEYQALLIELDALERALRQLQTLRPAKHELIQLTSIQATASACQRPLQDFLVQISKFDGRLGTFNAMNNRWKGLPRRMQFRIMFKEDVKKLRSVLASHVGTINILLMTQTMASISVAEDDRDRLASNLESKILAHRRLLEDVNSRVDSSLGQQLEIKTQLENQSTLLDELGEKADETFQHLHGQEASIQKIQTTAGEIREQVKPVVVMVTKILALVTSGLLNLRQIAKQLRKMSKICATFTAEMKTTMSKLMELFLGLQTTLQRIDRNIPMHLYLPTVQLTTALGETMALPHQLCQQWVTFKELLRVIFRDKPGKARVDRGKYLIMNARGGRLLAEGSWQHAVKQDDHLSMSIVLDELAAAAGSCPFPSCQASTGDVEVDNGGRTCGKCGRWSLPMLPDESSRHIESRLGTAADRERTNRATDLESASNSNNNCLEEEAQLVEDSEDIELYRQIQVRVNPILGMEFLQTQVSVSPTFATEEKRFILAGIIKVSIVDIHVLVDFIKSNRLPQQWFSIQLPIGRSLRECMQAARRMFEAPTPTSAQSTTPPTLEFTDNEKRFILAEVIKVSTVNIHVLIDFIKSNRLPQQWFSIQLPLGRSLRECMEAVESMFEAPASVHAR